ncbi:DUF7507 domain-containing protein, partial [Flavobacterium gawalongense]|uniref:DUF7507 domain-containing protein n=1 Tax=Flavobacterium gawalongense TaxID=2594432 RepID=UPI00163D7E23
GSAIAATSEDLSGIGAGVYEVTVTDTKGCKAVKSITITQPTAALTCSITQNKAVSSNGLSDGEATVTPLGGNGGYTYLWDNGETTAQAIALNAGPHSVTVTDSKECQTTCEITITEPNVLSCSITQDTPAKCYGDSNGIATVTAIGGNGDYTYLWDNEETTAQATALNAGTHTVTVTDKLGYKTTCSVIITQPDAAISATAAITNNNNCVGCSNGAIDLTVSGGTMPYTFIWSNEAITEDISNLPKGNYTVEIKDKNGCTANYTFEITESGIALVKTGVFSDTNNDGFAQVGEIINYTFAVTNIGNVTVTNIVITDLDFEGLTISNSPINSLAPGATDSSVTGTYTITQTDIDAGKVTNSAFANGKDPDNEDVTDTSGTTNENNTPTVTPLTQTPGIILVKTGVFVDENNDGYAQLGETINYTFAVTNIGNVTITNIEITDLLVTVNGGPIGTLAVGATDNTTVTASYSLTQADIDAGQVTNVATATGQDPKGNDVTHTDDTTVDLTNAQKPEIALVKTGVFVDENNDGYAQVGETINYTFAVTNTGNVTVTNIIITDPLITVVGGPIGTLAVGATDNTTITASYPLTQADIDAGQVTNVATAAGQDPKGNDVTHTDDTTVDLTNAQNPKIALVKTGVFSDTNNDGFAQVGEKINYTFTVTNTGNVTLTNIVITDPLIGLIITGNPIASLAPGATNNSVTGIYTVTQADIDAGKVTNSALATGKDPKGNDVTDISGTTVENNTPTDTPLPQKPSIALVKTGVFSDTNNDGFAQVGEKINYTFAVTNTGNVIVTNIIITDPLPLIGLIITGNPIASLASGATNSSVTGTYTITQADIDAGRVTNSALATGKDPKGNDVTDISGTTVENNTPTVTPLTQNPRLEVTKNATTTEYSLVGDIINYTIQVKNTGNVTLHQIIVTDPLTGLNTTIESLTPGSSSQVFPQSYTIIKNDLTNGSVTNTATANGLTPDGNHIIDTDTVKVDKALVLGCGTILVHNAFSPNGDGINEKFTIDNINDIDCYPDNTVEIYNRWGVLVFDTRNYNNDSNYFDGISRGRTTISQSSGLPTGTYYYILNYTSVDLNGDIHANKKDGYLYLTR